MYSMMCTRLDIFHAIGMTRKYQSNPSKEHWKVVKRILRYLKGTIGYSLCYQGKELRLKWYTDADWGGDLDERKSTSGFAFLLYNGAISWSSKKQSYIALSIMETEFVALLAIVQEGMWLRRFMKHLINNGDAIELVLISCDS